jgi:hypothetical protein
MSSCEHVIFSKNDNIQSNLEKASPGSIRALAAIRNVAFLMLP